MLKEKYNKSLSKTIEAILCQPTSPFRESWVKCALRGVLFGKGIPFFDDEFGNIWIGHSNLKSARKASLAFIAHLDHPGMVIEKFEKTKSARPEYLAYAKWLGGGPMDIRNQDCKIFSDVHGLQVFDAKVKSFTAGPRGPEKVVLKLVSPEPIAEALWNKEGFKTLAPWGACFWYPNHDVKQGVLHSKKHAFHKQFNRPIPLWITKAADDLIGVCSIVEAFEGLPKHSSAVGILTRAEESGFHGSLAVLEKGYLNPNRTKILSIETSSELPMALAGQGPVLRQGDKVTLFDSHILRAMEKVSVSLQKKKRDFTFQKRVMDAGTCEATAFKLYGFDVAGISVPLLNYHNISKSGKPEPEAVAAKDVENLVHLLKEIILTNDAGSFFSTSKLKADILKNHTDHAIYF